MDLAVREAVVEVLVVRPRHEVVVAREETVGDVIEIVLNERLLKT
jgi:hypothetical protein